MQYIWMWRKYWDYERLSAPEQTLEWSSLQNKKLKYKRLKLNKIKLTLYV